jgi:ATP-binding cassette, subfamily C, bacterial LapB
MGRQTQTIAEADPPAQDAISTRTAASLTRGGRTGKRSEPPAGRPGADGPDSGPALTGDPLFSVVGYLAALSGKSVSRDAILAGLPLVRGKLTERLLPDALARVGLSISRVRKSFSQLADFEMPAIFVSLQGKIQVCLGRDPSGLYRCFDGESEQVVLLDRTNLNLRLKRNFLVVRPDVKNAQPDRAKAENRKRRWLTEAFAGHWKSLAYIMLAATFINVFALAFPIFTLTIYDRVLPNSAVATLWVLAIGLLVVVLFDTVLKLGRGAIIDYVGRKVDYRLSSTLFERVLNTSLASRPSSTGAFINRVGQYEVLREFFASGTLALFVDVLFMGVFAYVIALLVGWVVVFPLLAGVLSVIVTLTIGSRSGASVEAALAEASVRNAILVETLSAPQTIKSARAEGEFQRRWQNTVLATSETQNRIKWYQSLATNFSAVASQLSLVAIIIGGTYLFADGQISMGAIIASMMLSNRLIGPINQLAALLLRARAALEATRTVGSIMMLPDERETGAQFVRRSIAKGQVEFRKVRFAYPGSTQFVLDQVSFAINPGEKVGVIGRIGSGKTTIGRLLVNFYQPSEGEILIDGVAIGQYHPHELRRQVGLVVQDPELFNGTVRENILLSKPEATDDELLEAARRAGVEQFVARHPMGYDMPVGERGALLSGGQRQAIALARTMLVKPTILFLDEPSSSMDLATERQLIGHLGASLAPESTVIIATHRYSLLSLVSRLIVIDNGRIVADGLRDTVLQQLKSRGEPT